MPHTFLSSCRRHTRLPRRRAQVLCRQEDGECSRVSACHNADGCGCDTVVDDRRAATPCAPLCSGTPRLSPPTLMRTRAGLPKERVTAARRPPWGPCAPGSTPAGAGGRPEHGRHPKCIVATGFTPRYVGGCHFGCAYRRTGANSPGRPQKEEARRGLAPPPPGGTLNYALRTSSEVLTALADAQGVGRACETERPDQGWAPHPTRHEVSLEDRGLGTLRRGRCKTRTRTP